MSYQLPPLHLEPAGDARQAVAQGQRGAFDPQALQEVRAAVRWFLPQPTCPGREGAESPSTGTSPWPQCKCSPASVHLEFILLVLGAFVKRSVVPEPPHVVDAVEALDTVWDPIHLQDVHIIWNGRHCIDLQVWLGSEGETQTCQREGPEELTRHPQRREEHIHCAPHGHNSTSRRTSHLNTLSSDPPSALLRGATQASAPHLPPLPPPHARGCAQSSKGQGQYLSTQKWGRAQKWWHCCSKSPGGAPTPHHGQGSSRWGVQGALKAC